MPCSQVPASADRNVQLLTTYDAAGNLTSDGTSAFTYDIENRLVAAIIGINILWATGGGALNLVYERLGSVTFAGRGGPASAPAAATTSAPPPAAARSAGRFPLT